ncbi:VWA domain-containing protein [Deinococcus peraridilitoris]|uniref:Mg-chelatase subunit ChlI n=1 Tax=Deinococcus peraridilitoris (strain DSM 19664 / LMG 22246 / CIP 109416 / KR-200) TaxID=937777 RepID=L0A439_DEIPD|nr:VWA domain-containing protein [Deinococcus peraridilitoris]AFZ67795.1 Mg-chelatase subunit ChlI [Deinococcus peraridilitoris DSM 19664]
MSFPFSAIVGQDDLKLALLLLAVNPAVGGVLVRGDKGSAKSTTARALAELMPGGEERAPFVTLPLGATEDRVIGTLDLERALKGEKALQRGLIAQAHGGVLYIDEVNLLPDHLVDVLLDVAAMGVNRVQREGLSAEHAAVFSLVGTMNPEEGNLRPQFLDRFGLCVEVATPDDPRERAEIVRRRVRYEADPHAYAAGWQAEQDALRRALHDARVRLPGVELPDGLLETISALCRSFGVRSLRADLVLHRATRALAALEGRETVTLEDVKRAAPLVLAHRGRQNPLQPGGGQDGQDLDELLDGLQPPPPRDVPGEPGELGEPQDPEPQDNGPEDGALPTETDTHPEATFTASSRGVARIELRGAPGEQSGRSSLSQGAPRGRTVRERKNEQPGSLAVSTTLLSAADRAARAGTPLSVTRDDLYERVREERTGVRVLFVVDASGSMGARARMEAVKGAALGLLADAYARRDEVGVIAFRGVRAELLLPFTRDTDTAQRALQQLPTGGRTPLAHALTLAGEVLHSRQDGALLVVLTDGRGNVPLPGGGDAWAQTLSAAAALAGTPALVLDTETGVVRAGRAAELARALGAECLTPEALSAETLTLALRARTPSAAAQYRGTP